MRPRSKDFTLRIGYGNMHYQTLAWKNLMKKGYQHRVSQ